MSKAQLRQLSQRLRRDPRTALEGFYRHAGLDVSAGNEPAGAPEDLLWGLRQLEDGCVAPSLPAGWRAWCGAEDALLDAARLHALAPAVTILPGATHHPRELIAAFAAEVKRGAGGGIERGAVASAASFSAWGSMRSTAVSASFDRAASAYLRHAGAQDSLAAWLADWLPAVRQGRAVEIGAGPGVFTQRLLPWTGDLAVTDISPAMCAAGRRRLPQVPWRTMAAEAPEGGPWDWLFSSSMLQWLDDPAAVLAAWRRRLAPGGRVLGGLLAAGTLEEWNLLAGETPVRWRPAEEWRVLLEASGLRLLREESVRRVFYHPSAAALLRSLHGAGAAPFRLVQPARLRELLREYEKGYRTAEGVPASWQFYRFEAEVD